MKARQIFILNDSYHELEAALHLRHCAMVLVKTNQVGDANTLQLEKAGFYKIPRYIEPIISFPFSIERLRRKHKVQLLASLKEWQLLNLSFELNLCQSISKREMIQNFYEPVVLPEFYAKGISPYNAHNREHFDQLVRDENYFAALYQNGQLVGGALLKPSFRDAEQLYLKGKHISGSGPEGLLFCLRPELKNCKRAFIYHLIRSFEHIGAHYFSYGRDLAWIEDGYLDKMLEKLRWASCVGVSDNRYPFYLHPGMVDGHHFSGMHLLNCVGNEITLQRLSGSAEGEEEMTMRSQRLGNYLNKKINYL